MAIALLLRNIDEVQSDDVMEILYYKNGYFDFSAYDPFEDFGSKSICISIEDAKQVVEYLQKHIEAHGKG